MNEYLFDYSDLSSLCADRELTTSELHATNDFYGQASVLKRYAGLDEDYSLKAVLEHGINLDDQMWDHDRDSSMPFIFSPSEWRAIFHQDCSGKKSFPIGFGYLYAKKLVEQVASPVRTRQGTIAFPCHSTHTIRAKFDHEDYADRLLALPDFMHPISVCLYWKNYLLGENEPYESKGIQVYSAGHMFDKDFMLRLHDLSRRNQFSTSNEVGSHLFLTVSSGCRFVFTESAPIDWEIPAAEITNCAKENRLFQERCETARKLFGDTVQSDNLDLTPVQVRFVDELIGSDCLQKPVDLKKVIDRAESAFKRDQWAGWMKRRFSKIGRIGRSIAKRLPWRKAG